MKSNKSTSRHDLEVEVKKFLDRKIHDICEKKGLSFTRNTIHERLNLYESGILDSFDLYQFLLFIEDGLSVEMEISEMDPDDFTIYGRLVQLIVEAKLNYLAEQQKAE